MSKKEKYRVSERRKGENKFIISHKNKTKRGGDGERKGDDKKKIKLICKVKGEREKIGGNLFFF